MKYLVKVVEYVEVTADSKEDAINLAGNMHPNADSITVSKHLWHDDALRLLQEGASYNEVERTLGVQRKYVARAFPGYGMSKADGARWREQKKQLERLPDMLTTITV